MHVVICLAVAASVVFQDETSIAFLDHRPVFPGHTLLIPKQHFETLADLPAPLLQPYFAGAQLPEGLFRVTCLANYDLWAHLPEEQYQADKQRWFEAAVHSARRFLPAVDDAVLAQAQLTTDMFTPRTIRTFTGHLNGAIYGAPHKIRNGRTHLSNLYLCGTDQGFLGIVGAMLSGISMANYHVLQPKG